MRSPALPREPARCTCLYSAADVQAGRRAAAGCYLRERLPRRRWPFIAGAPRAAQLRMLGVDGCAGPSGALLNALPLLFPRLEVLTTIRAFQGGFVPACEVVVGGAFRDGEVLKRDACPDACPGKQKKNCRPG